MLPRGCETILVELLRGAVISTALVAAAGWMVSQPANVSLVGADLSAPKGFSTLDQRIETNDHFLVVLSRPRAVDRVHSTQAEHTSLINCTRRLVKQRLDKGCCVLVEGALLTSGQDSNLTDGAHGCPDAVGDVSFRYRQGDRHIPGQMDWYTGLPAYNQTT
jgi:hypothetical protein